MDEPTATKPPTIYDIYTDRHVEATQPNIDSMMSKLGIYGDLLQKLGEDVDAAKKRLAEVPKVLP